MCNILNLKEKVEQITYFYSKILEFEKEIDELVREKAKKYIKDEEIDGWDLLWIDGKPTLLCYPDEDSWNDFGSFEMSIEVLWDEEKG